MTDRTSKILQWFLYALLIISAVLGILFYMDFGRADILIYWGYALLGFTFIITVLASLSSLLLKPKSAVKFLITLGIMVVLGIVAYSLATNEFSPLQLEKMDISEIGSRIVGAGLIFMYILAGLAILAIFYSAISSVFK